MIPAAGPFGTSARSRLLPMWVPFRYFAAAVLFHICAWALLIPASGDLARFAGGPGPILAALHLFTLGVLAMTAIGASLQLLPIATRQPVRSVAAAKLTWWLLAPGCALFALGAALYRPFVMGAGALATALALLIYAVLLADNLLRARGMRVVVAHGWAALASLALLVLSGFALAAGYAHGFAFDRSAVALAHLIFAAYGFMSLLALGFSHLLLPMFALSPAPAPSAGFFSLGAAVGAIALAATSLALGWGAFALAGAAALGFAAALLHVTAMERALSGRLRGPLGPAFILVRVSWAFLLASLGTAFAAALGWIPAHAAALFGLMLVPGWLLTFMLAILQRIVPFLSTVHAAGPGRRAPLVSELTPERPLAAHRWLHLAALAALVAGVGARFDWLARLGAVLGLAAALAFGVFFATVLLRLREFHQRAAAAPESAGA